MAMAEMVIESYTKALALGKISARNYELQEAAHTVLTVPDAFTRWLDGADAFASAQLNQSEYIAPPKLIDLRKK